MELTKSIQQKWEYIVVEINKDDDLERELNAYGRRNWELVSVTSFGGYVCIFKRPE